MFDPIWKWLAAHCPFLLLLIAVAAVVWYLAWLVFHWTHRIKQAEEDCKKIEGHIMPQLTSIGSSFTSLSGSFNSLVVHLQAKDGSGNFPAQIFMSKSPIRLTDLGWEILSAIGGKLFVDTHTDLLIKKMDTIGVKTALDSQTIAPIIINQIATEDSFNSIKNYIYKNPLYKINVSGKEESVPLDMSMVSNIMGIYLRDKYLEKHTNLNPDDIP